MAKDIKTYYEQSYIDNTLRLREVLKTLPSFVKDYFRAIEPTTSAKTRISYAYDLRVFLNYLIENNPIITKEEIWKQPNKYLIQNGYDRSLRSGNHEIPVGATEEEMAQILCELD